MLVTDVQPLDGIERRFPTFKLGSRQTDFVRDFSFLLQDRIQRRLPFYSSTIDRFGVVSVLPVAGENEAAETDVGDA